MDRARWRRIDEVFAAALEQPVERRAELLDRTCGDDADLRSEVESLLAHHRDDAFLASSATTEVGRVLVATRPAPLVGERLGRFEVLAALGAGGMGEVYLARDPKLERRVALKLLAPHLANDPERIRRFRREALAVSALNHPNILTVHEIVEADGCELLVSELVEGVTLRERLRRGPLPPATAVELVAQIARGLAAAHAVGIVHRDVKPENVMIREDGLVKLLDFGLAKSPGARDGPDLAHSPTQVVTGSGVILGTASYMSPEQARGEPAGAQSDIWALGCVLYEALTGRQAFPGATSSDVLAAILAREPDWEALPADTPRLVRSVLRRCLQKDREQRLHAVADARLELEEALREPATAGAMGEGSRSRGWPRALAGSAAAAGMVVLTLVAWQLARSAARSPQLHGRFQLQPPPGIALVGGSEPTLAIAPDGRSVAFVGEGSIARQLFIRRIEELAAEAIPGTEDATGPFFSPDGRWLAFHARGAVRKVPITGGEPLVVCDAPHLRGASWGDDGSIVFSTGEGLLRVPAAGGKPEAITLPGSARSDRWPHHLPGGHAVLFLRYSGMGEGNNEIVVRSLVTGKERTLLRGGTYPRHAQGQLVFSRLGTLYAAPFDSERLELDGEPRPVLDDVEFSRGSGSVLFDLARSGSLVWSPGSSRLRDAELVRVDRRGRISALAERQAPYGDQVFPSPDGRRIGVFIRSSLEEADLWICELTAKRWTRLTADGKAWAWGLWSPDGRWIFYSALVQGIPKIFRIAADGGSPPEQVTTGTSWDYADSMTPDGNTLMLQRGLRAGDLDLATVDLRADRTPRPFVATPMVENQSELSRDGRWVLYNANYEGTVEVYARPFPGPGAQVRVSSGGGSRPRWSPRGDEIFYRCPDPGSPQLRAGTDLPSHAATESLCAAAVQTGARLTVSPPRRLFTFEQRLAAQYTVSPDGSSFYMVRSPPEARSERRLIYAPSWIEELATVPR